jgi:hypothetical protein
MIENLIVALIVGAAGWSVWARYKPGKKAGCGTGGGCDTCGSCETPAEPAGQRVIKIHVRS